MALGLGELECGNQFKLRLQCRGPGQVTTRRRRARTEATRLLLRLLSVRGRARRTQTSSSLSKPPGPGSDVAELDSPAGAGTGTDCVRLRLPAGSRPARTGRWAPDWPGKSVSGPDSDSGTRRTRPVVTSIQIGARPVSGPGPRRPGESLRRSVAPAGRTSPPRVRLPGSGRNARAVMSQPSGCLTDSESHAPGWVPGD